MTPEYFPSWLKTVHHDGSEKYVSDPYPKLGDTICLRLRVGKDSPIDEVYLRTFPDGEQSLSPMNTGEANSVSNWWEVDLYISEPIVHYRFLLFTREGIWSYTAAGPVSHIPLDSTDFRIIAGYSCPSWLHETVFYQIFPDRFSNGDATTNPTIDEYDYKGFGPKTFPWGTKPSEDQPFPTIFYGGDLIGINQKLDYLQGLGVNALYLNPIFTIKIRLLI